jgi:hypothetical protein
MGLTHPKQGFCQGCGALVLPLTKTKLAIIERAECGDCSRAHSLTEQHCTNAPSRTDNTTRAPKTKGGRPPAKGRQEADRSKAINCLAEHRPHKGDDLCRWVCPLMVVSDAVTLCRAAKWRGILGKGDSERARENQGGKPRAGGLPCIRHNLTQSNFYNETICFVITQGVRLTETLTADGIRPLAAKVGRKGLQPLSRE